MGTLALLANVRLGRKCVKSEVNSRVCILKYVAMKVIKIVRYEFIKLFLRITEKKIFSIILTLIT